MLCLSLLGERGRRRVIALREREGESERERMHIQLRGAKVSRD